MAEYGGLRTSMDRTAALSVGSIPWGRVADGRTALAGKKGDSMPLAYRALAMMLAVYLALRAKR